MSYTISKLENIAACDQLLATLEEQGSDFDFKIMTIQNRIDNAPDPVALQNQINAETQHLNTLSGLLTTIPEGPEKNDLLDEINKYENNIIELEMKKDSDGPIAKMKRTFDFNLAERKETVNNDLIAQVQAKKTELSAS
jgi:hypothetical protein